MLGVKVTVAGKYISCWSTTVKLGQATATPLSGSSGCLDLIDAWKRTDFFVFLESFAICGKEEPL